MSAKAQARMAGHVLCWQAAIIEIARHSSRQKPQAPSGLTEMGLREDTATAFDHIANELTAASACLGPRRLEYRRQTSCQQPTSLFW